MIVRGVDACPSSTARRPKPTWSRSRPTTTRSRCAGGRPHPRGRRPRDRRGPRTRGVGTSGGARKREVPVHHQRRRPRAVPRPVHRAGHGRGDAQAGGACVALTEAPPPLGDAEGHGVRVLRVRHPLPRRQAPEGGRGGRHRGGHHDPGRPDRQERGPGLVEHRRPDHRRPRPQARLRSRDHPPRPRRTLRDPRRRPHVTLPPHLPADRDPRPRQALHRRRL